MAAGEYEFGTAGPESMKVVSGELTVRLPGEQTWSSFGPGQEFLVPGKSKFSLKVRMPTAYLCRYL